MTTGINLTEPAAALLRFVVANPWSTREDIPGGLNVVDFMYPTKTSLRMLEDMDLVVCDTDTANVSFRVTPLGKRVMEEHDHGVVVGQVRRWKTLPHTFGEHPANNKTFRVSEFKSDGDVLGLYVEDGADFCRAPSAFVAEYSDLVETTT